MATVTNIIERTVAALEAFVIAQGGTLPTRDSVTETTDYQVELLEAANAGAVGGATFTIGAENANVINVAIQLTDGAGAALTQRAVVQVYLSNDANGDTIANTGTPAGLAIGTDGLYRQLVANLSGFCTSEADGDIDLNITNTGAGTQYLVVVLPNGSLVVSGAITFA